MKKRTKIIILAVMIVLLGVTGYLNIALNNSVSDTPTSTTTTSYFASYRQYREDRRDQMLLYYQGIAESETSTEEAVANANAAREALIAQIDKELVVEGLIMGLGFDDCVIALGSSDVNVLVDAASVSPEVLSQIVDIVENNLNIDFENINVIPVD